MPRKTPEPPKMLYALEDLVGTLEATVDKWGITLDPDAPKTHDDFVALHNGTTHKYMTITVVGLPKGIVQYKMRDAGAKYNQIIKIYSIHPLQRKNRELERLSVGKSFKVLSVDTGMRVPKTFYWKYVVQD